MAFTLRNLSVLAYAQGFTLWHYSSAADHLTSIHGARFFDDAVDMMNGGDMILVSAPDGGRASVIRAEKGHLTTVPMG